MWQISKFLSCVFVIFFNPCSNLYSLTYEEALVRLREDKPLPNTGNRGPLCERLLYYKLLERYASASYEILTNLEYRELDNPKVKGEVDILVRESGGRVVAVVEVKCQRGSPRRTERRGYEQLDRFKKHVNSRKSSIAYKDCKIELWQLEKKKNIEIPCPDFVTETTRFSKKTEYHYYQAKCQTQYGKHLDLTLKEIDALLEEVESSFSD